MFSKQTVHDIDVQGKTVLMRADFNVPLDNGKIADDYRIQQALPTIKFLLDHGAKLVLCSHLGRPAGSNDTSCSLWPVAIRLQELLGKENVTFAKDCIGPEVKKSAETLQPKQVLLLENLRFHPEEEKNDTEFAKQLVESAGAEVFVQDGFGVVHRAHASTDAVTRLLPAVAGFLLEREVDTITNVMQQPDRPLVAVVGGAKISDKIEVLHKFIDIADVVAIGGAMANTFLKANGHDVAKSLVEDNDLGIAKDILAKAREKAKQGNFIFYLPQDVVVAHKIDKATPTRIVDWSAHAIAAIENYPKRPPNTASEIKDDEMILDIGPFSASFIAGTIQLAKTVVWNGTMGVAELTGLQGPIGPYAHGTRIVMDAMLGQMGNKPFSLAGGGDTVSFIESQGLVEHFNHVSTGGGASLELMAGRKLPGVEALMDK
ncbi:phosphoglycerate kinase [soil metagenome]